MWCVVVQWCSWSAVVEKSYFLSRIFRPTITIDDEQTQVLIEQTSAVAVERLGEFVARVTYEELVAINDGLRLVLELD